MFSFQQISQDWAFWLFLLDRVVVLFNKLSFSHNTHLKVVKWFSFCSYWCVENLAVWIGKRLDVMVDTISPFRINGTMETKIDDLYIQQKLWEDLKPKLIQMVYFREEKMWFWNELHHRREEMFPVGFQIDNLTISCYSNH